MKSNVKIRKGLDRLKNLLKNVPNPLSAAPISISAPTLVSSSLAAPRHVAPTMPLSNRLARPAPTRALPPLPQALPSLADFYAEDDSGEESDFYNVDDQVNGAHTAGYGVQISAASSNIEATINRSLDPDDDVITLGNSNGPLHFQEELQYYQEFADWEDKATKAACKAEPNGYRGLQGENFHLEKLRSEHRSGSMMGQLILYYNKYSQHFNGASFTDFLTRVSEADLQKILKLPDVAHSKEYIRRFRQGVRYLTPEKREKYNVVAKNNKLFWAKWGLNTPLDTKSPEYFKRKHEQFLNVKSRDDIAIWVLSKEEELYTHAAKVHRFHHSSFTAGDIIIGAGDWEVQDGKLIWLSVMSGHYRPTFEHLLNTINVLTKKYKINPGSYQVKIVRCAQGYPEVQIPASTFASERWQREESSKHLPCKK